MNGAWTPETKSIWWDIVPLVFHSLVLFSVTWSCPAFWLSRIRSMFYHLRFFFHFYLFYSSWFRESSMDTNVYTLALKICIRIGNIVPSGIVRICFMPHAAHQFSIPQPTLNFFTYHSFFLVMFEDWCRLSEKFLHIIYRVSLLSSPSSSLEHSVSIHCLHHDLVWKMYCHDLQMNFH